MHWNLMVESASFSRGCDTEHVESNNHSSLNFLSYDLVTKTHRYCRSCFRWLALCTRPADAKVLIGANFNDPRPDTKVSCH